MNNARLVSLTPVASLVLIEGGALGQIVCMWREQTAAGQSLVSWLAVTAALVLWFNYYRVIMPELRLPRVTALIGITMLEQQYPLHSKVELFARQPRAGWDVWGNEVQSALTL